MTEIQKECLTSLYQLLKGDFNSFILGLELMKSLYADQNPFTILNEALPIDCEFVKVKCVPYIQESEDGRYEMMDWDVDMYYGSEPFSLTMEEVINLHFQWHWSKKQNYTLRFFKAKLWKLGYLDWEKERKTNICILKEVYGIDEYKDKVYFYAKEECTINPNTLNNGLLSPKTSLQLFVQHQKLTNTNWYEILNLHLKTLLFLFKPDNYWILLKKIQKDNGLKSFTIKTKNDRTRNLYLP